MSIIDYSTAHPTMNMLKNAGVTAVGRYIGWDSVPGFSSTGKNITPAESQALLAAGIDIFLVFEYLADAAARGAPQGIKDGTLSRTQVAQVHAPPSIAVYYAVDYDIPDYAPHLADIPSNARAKLGPIGDYFAAINGLKLASATGGYGGYWLIKRLFDAKLITYGWQTVAWSGTNPPLLDPRACLYQTAGRSPILGTDIDIHEHAATQADFGQYPRPVTPAVAYNPATPPPGIWKAGSLVMTTGVGTDGKNWRSVTCDGIHWAGPVPAGTDVPSLPAGTVTFSCVTAPPGWYKLGSILTASGTGTDGKNWATGTSDGAKWSAPISVSTPAPVSWSAVVPVPGSWALGSTLTATGTGPDGVKYTTTTKTGRAWTAPVKA